jgi:hypothetical protein
MNPGMWHLCPYAPLYDDLNVRSMDSWSMKHLTCIAGVAEVLTSVMAPHLLLHLLRPRVARRKSNNNNNALFIMTPTTYTHFIGA